MENFRDTIDYDGMGNQGRIGTRQIYKKFDCPIVDSYSNRIDWVSIFD